MSDTSTPTPGQRTHQILGASRGAAERCSRDDLVARLDEASARLSSPDVTILVIGEFKQGKSSLVNALVNAPACPVDDDVTTAVPTVIRYAENSEASVTCDGEADPDDTVTYAIDVKDAGAYVTAGVLADSGRRIRAVEIGLPRKLLDLGLRLVDTPGVGGLDSAHGQATLGALAMADAVIFVTDCSQELTASELEFLQRAEQRCPAVLCVMPKIDFYPRWETILERNREHLARADLSVDIYPISSELRLKSTATNDRQLNVESGFPQLVRYLQNDVLANTERTLITGAMADVATVVAQLTETERTERDLLADPSRQAELLAAATDAKERADRMRSAASRWNTKLNDGVADLTSDTDHDLRSRTRALLTEVEKLIEDNDPTDMGDELFPMVEERLMADIAENYRLMAEKADVLSLEVMELFDADMATDDVPEVAAPAALLDHVGRLDVDIAERPNLAASMLTGLRGSYGGMLMFGMLGSVVGLATFGPVSLGAGALLGRKAAKEERARQLTLRQQQAKMGIRKYVDEVVFKVSKHSRDSLKMIQRELRETNMTRAAEHNKTAAEALKTAQGAVQTGETETKQRLEALDASLDQLARVGAAAEEITS